MSDERAHDLDAEFIYPSDVDVLETGSERGDLVFTLALPCPECGTALKVETRSEPVVEGDFELLLDDSLYD